MIIDPNKDGIDHINIYSKGKTRLGRELTNFAHTPFKHPEDGYFKSVEGYWYWLGCKDDRLRQAYGYKAKELGRKIGAPDWLDTEDFKRKIRLAIRTKLKTHPGILRRLVETDLPLVHYYVYGNIEKGSYKVNMVPQGDWIIEEIEKIRDEHK